ncbi:MAG: DoxX family protein [Thermodesulfovibrionales bacterium]
MFRTGRSPALLFIRLALGAVMFTHGAQKVLGWYGGPGFQKTMEIFSGMGYAPWMTILLMFIEFLGSLGLVFGLLTRLSALGITITISVCAYTNHLQNGFFMNWFGNQAGEGVEYHVLVIGMTLALMASGGGLLSVDRAIYTGEKKG